MKKSILKASFIAALLIFTSCGDDGDNEDENPKDGLSGTITEDTILDGEYDLVGAYIVPAGKTLTIAAGTKITAEAGGTEVYIGVNKGGTINVEGTATNPVVISSIDGEQSDWGGLVICGKGITSAGTDVAFEVGGFLYGGTDSADSSGSIEYLVIQGSGAQINADAQYNGISFCAVGSGTVVNNVAVINGGDDGVEFYGGSVAVSNLYLEDNLDDSIDWTEKWNGSVTDAYILHNVQGFSTVFEGDKDNGSPVFSNITAISSTQGTALQFKKESGAIITNLYLDGYDLEIDFKDGGAHSNVQIDGSDAVILGDDTATQGKLDYTIGTQVDISGWDWISATL